MVDTGTAIRAAYFEILNGNVFIEGAAIPFVDEKLDAEISEQDIYVLFTSQDEEVESESNKSQTVNDVLTKMQIVNRRRATGNKEKVEDVSNQILTLLFPTVNTWAVSLDDPLYLVFSLFVNGQYNPIGKDENGFIVSKILTFKNRITQ